MYSIFHSDRLTLSSVRQTDVVKGVQTTFCGCHPKMIQHFLSIPSDIKKILLDLIPLDLHAPNLFLQLSYFSSQIPYRGVTLDSNI